MCPTAWRVSQVRNKLNMLAGPLRVQGENLEPCPKSTLDLRSLSDIHNCQVSLQIHAQLKSLSLWHSQCKSLSDYIYPGSFTRIFNSDGTIPLVGGPDSHNKGPPRRLTLDTAQRQDSQIHEVSTLSDYPHILNISKPLFQWEQLWIVRIYLHINLKIQDYNLSS